MSVASRPVAAAAQEQAREHAVLVVSLCCEGGHLSVEAMARLAAASRAFQATLASLLSQTPTILLQHLPGLLRHAASLHYEEQRRRRIDDCLYEPRPKRQVLARVRWLCRQARGLRADAAARVAAAVVGLPYLPQCAANAVMESRVVLPQWCHLVAAARDGVRGVEVWANAALSPIQAMACGAGDSLRQAAAAELLQDLSGAELLDLTWVALSVQGNGSMQGVAQHLQATAAAAAGDERRRQQLEQWRQAVGVEQLQGLLAAAAARWNDTLVHSLLQSCAPVVRQLQQRVQAGRASCVGMLAQAEEPGRCGASLLVAALPLELLPQHELLALLAHPRLGQEPDVWEALLQRPPLVALLPPGAVADMAAGLLVMWQPGWDNWTYREDLDAEYPEDWEDWLPAALSHAQQAPAALAQLLARAVQLGDAHMLEWLAGQPGAAALTSPQLAGVLRAAELMQDAIYLKSALEELDPQGSRLQRGDVLRLLHAAVLGGSEAAVEALHGRYAAALSGQGAPSAAELLPLLGAAVRSGRRALLEACCKCLRPPADQEAALAAELLPLSVQLLPGSGDTSRTVLRRDAGSTLRGLKLKVGRITALDVLHALWSSGGIWGGCLALSAVVPGLCAALVHGKPAAVPLLLDLVRLGNTPAVHRLSAQLQAATAGRISREEVAKAAQDAGCSGAQLQQLLEAHWAVVSRSLPAEEAAAHAGQTCAEQHGSSQSLAAATAEGTWQLFRQLQALPLPAAEAAWLWLLRQPPAAHLDATQLCRALTAAVHHARPTLVAALCELPAAAALAPEHVVSLLRLAVEVACSAGANSPLHPSHVQQLRRLCGLRQARRLLRPEQAAELLLLAVQLRNTQAVQQLCRLPAAAGISRTGALGLLHAALAGWPLATDMLARLCRLPGSQQLPPLEACGLLRQLVFNFAAADGLCEAAATLLQLPTLKADATAGSYSYAWGPLLVAATRTSEPCARFRLVVQLCSAPAASHVSWDHCVTAREQFDTAAECDEDNWEYAYQHDTTSTHFAALQQGRLAEDERRAAQACLDALHEKSYC